MEDYIFIIIALVLSVIGAMNSTKKKRQQAMDHMDDEEFKPQRSVFEELFGDDLFMNGKQEANTVPPPVERTIQPKKKKVEAPAKMQAPPKMEYKPMERESLAKTHSRVKSNTPAPEMEKLSLEDEAKLSPKKLIMKDFTLRKAVLYSEILNRKY